MTTLTPEEVKRIEEEAKAFEKWRTNIGGWHRHLVEDYISTKTAEALRWKAIVEEKEIQMRTLPYDSVADYEICKKANEAYRKQLEERDKEISKLQSAHENDTDYQERLTEISNLKKELAKLRAVAWGMAEFIKRTPQRGWSSNLAKDLLTRYEQNKSK